MTQPDDPGPEPFMNPAKVRLLRILGRHAKSEDMVMEDTPFILTVIDRWERALAEPIIDVNE